MVARLIGGFGVGVSTIAAPVYIAEKYCNMSLSGCQLGRAIFDVLRNPI